MFSTDPPDAEKGKTSSSQRFTPEALRTAIRDLRAITNPDRRIQMVVQIVRNHGLDYPEVVDSARAEVEATRCSPHVRREALAQLQPRKLSLWQVVPEIAGQAPQASLGTDQPAEVAADVEGDPELTRIANGLSKAAAIRLWLVFHAINRAGSGAGQVDKTEAWEQLPAFGIQITRRYFNALIRRENGRFWAVSRDGRALHLRSYEKVSKRLMALALRTKPDLVLTNTPGQKFKRISVAGSIADFEARVISVWLDSRRDAGMTNIALSTLSALFGRSPNTLRDWLKRAGVQVQHNYTQYAGTNEQLVPDHANLYVTREGGYGITWQISNTYIPESTKERQHKRTPRRVYHVCQHMLEEWLEVHPAGDCGTVLCSSTGAKEDGGVYRTFRLFFDSSKGPHEARKNVHKHLDWHQDIERPHHVFLGFKSSQRAAGAEIGLYECVDPEGQRGTRLNERDYRSQYHPHHQQHIAGYRDYLAEG